MIKMREHRELMVELVAKKKELVALEKEIAVKKKAYNTNPEVVELEKRYVESDKEESKVRVIIDERQEGIRLRFLNYGLVTAYPQYARSGDWAGTNINPKILDAIKKATGVAVSQLKGSQVEEIVRQMIRKEYNADDQLRSLQGKKEHLRDEQTKVNNRLEEIREVSDIPSLNGRRIGLVMKLQELTKQALCPKAVERKEKKESDRHHVMGRIDDIYDYLKEHGVI